jgi:outer membrane protein OmpA-like peptidoglycan-associated protein
MNINRLKLVILFLCFSAKQFPAFAGDTAKIYFRLNDKNIKESTRILDSVSSLKNISSISIIGYTDYLGTNAYNAVLSKNRADAVKAYLAPAFPNLKIKATGIGEIYSAVENAGGEPLHRRVDIVISFKPASRESSSNKTPAKEVFIMQELSTLAVGDKLVLNTFHFIGGRHFLLPQYVSQLDTLAGILKENPGVKVEIQGFVCCTYEFDGLDYDTGEKTLSVNRARHIYEQLIQRGISGERMRYRGFGSKVPRVFPEITEEDKTANRRVELLIIGNE